jgi:exopolyphosphatase/guanosine-5'-triphosphate,3'-diphosphate pyrophosphatase
VANIARYHRGAPPKTSHENLAGLTPELRKQIRRLSAILRLADGLDRGHVGGVADVKVRWLQRAIRIHPTPVPKAILRLELWGAARKAALLADVAGVPVEVVGPDGKPVEVRTDDGDGD